jgi:hypothetical protein
MIGGTLSSLMPRNSGGDMELCSSMSLIGKQSLNVEARLAHESASMFSLAVIYHSGRYIDTTSIGYSTSSSHAKSL